MKIVSVVVILFSILIANQCLANTLEIGSEDRCKCDSPLEWSGAGQVLLTPPPPKCHGMVMCNGNLCSAAICPAIRAPMTNTFVCPPADLCYKSTQYTHDGQVVSSNSKNDY